jgi:hypothetical protein
LPPFIPWKTDVAKSLAYLSPASSAFQVIAAYFPEAFATAKTAFSFWYHYIRLS